MANELALLLQKVGLRFSLSMDVASCSSYNGLSLSPSKEKLHKVCFMVLLARLNLMHAITKCLPCRNISTKRSMFLDLMENLKLDRTVEKFA